MVKTTNFFCSGTYILQSAVNTCPEFDHAQSFKLCFLCVLLTFLTSGFLQMFNSIKVLFSKIFTGVTNTDQSNCLIIHISHMHMQGNGRLA